MSGFKNIGLKDYFKRYGIKNAIKRGVFTACPIHIVNDYENRKILYYKKVRRTLERKYMRYALNNPEGITFGNSEYNNPVWIYWKQGLDKAPEIVQKCIKSVKENTQQDVIIITDENLGQFVTFPQVIIDKVEKGNISAAAFSDLLRFSLLEHYGGIWIDATVLLTGELPDYITHSDIFVYRDVFGLIENPAELSVWIMHSKKGNSVVSEARNILFAYWERESHVIEYLLPYIVLTMVMERHEEVYMPYANSDYCRLLFNELANKYDPDRFRHITGLSSVHKLSYKLKETVYTDKNNFYNYIVNMD